MSAAPSTSRASMACRFSNSHRQDGIDRVLGVVRSARLADGQLIVTVQLSERSEPVWHDIKAGIIRNVSVGYSIEDFVDGSDRATGQRVRTVTKWMLHEVSLVPVGADAGAKTRGSDDARSKLPAPAAHRAGSRRCRRRAPVMTRAGGQSGNPRARRDVQSRRRLRRTA